MTIGQRIMELRHWNGWTQQELADRAGTSKEMVCYWENDSHKPNWYALGGLCEAFNLTITGLVKGVKIETRTKT